MSYNKHGDLEYKGYTIKLEDGMIKSNICYILKDRKLLAEVTNQKTAKAWIDNHQFAKTFIERVKQEEQNFAGCDAHQCRGYTEDGKVIENNPRYKIVHITTEGVREEECTLCELCIENNPYLKLQWKRYLDEQKKKRKRFVTIDEEGKEHPIDCSDSILQNYREE